MHKLQSLNGIWDYRAAEGPWDKRAIPYADLPVGFAECRRTFDVPDGCVGRRAFLRLEGITYEADVTLNGESLGRMFPYVPYEFEVTEKLRPVENELRVAIRDLSASGKVFLPLNGSGRALYLIGSVSMPKGFPIEGAFGEEAGQCAVCYADGGRKVFPLRNGHEITTAAGWFGPSRIRPVASNAPCVLRFINDPDRERYVAHLLRLPLETGRELCGLEIRAGDGYALLYYGVTIAR